MNNIVLVVVLVVVYEYSLVDASIELVLEYLVELVVL